MPSRLHDVIRLGEAVFLRLVLDAVSDCLVVVDTDGQIVLINRPYCDLLGGAPEDFQGRHIRDAVSPASNLAEVARGAPPAVGTRLVVRGREILTRQVPIALGGETIGALGVALFANSKMALSTLRQLTGDSLVVPPEHMPWRARYTVDDLVGRGAEMQKLRAQVRQAARSAYPVLIHGETGVGKELVAQAIHRLSNRAGAPFVWINCTTIPPDLVASELFGYEGGSFTGAHARGSKGKIELASGGTLFLDEIGDMPLQAQAALLRFLQEGEVTRVGGSRPNKVDVAARGGWSSGGCVRDRELRVAGGRFAGAAGEPVVSRARCRCDRFGHNLARSGAGRGAQGGDGSTGGQRRQPVAGGAPARHRPNQPLQAPARVGLGVSGSRRRLRHRTEATTSVQMTS